MSKLSVSSQKTKQFNRKGSSNSKENKSLILKKENTQVEPDFTIITKSLQYNVEMVDNTFIVRPYTQETSHPNKSQSQTLGTSRSKKGDEIPKTPNKTTIKPNISGVNTKQKLFSAQSKIATHTSLTTYSRINSPLNASSRLLSRDQNCILTKKSREFLTLVNQAIKLQKIFCIGNQNRKAFPTVRSSLMERGWVEKCSAEVMAEEESINSKTAEITIRLLKEAPVNFVWVMNSIDFGSFSEDAIISRFPKNNHFSTKVGLWHFMEDFHWFYQPNVSQTITPKTFRVSNKEEMDIFMKEFCLSACVGLLKIIVNQVATADSDSFFRNGMVPLSVFDFANAQCSEYILHRHHDDIDRKNSSETTLEDWNNYLFWFYKIAHEKENFETTSYPMIQALYTMSKMTLKNMEPYWPLLELEGCCNLWVIKPPADFCGRGVRVMQTIHDIINHVQLLGDNKYSRCIIQKYIERPLLVYGTKFDIRQWFLVTSVYPLVIWIARECYLRFSSQPFSLVNLHESVHLTNNAIQKNYTNSNERDTRLPAENMWHCSTFQQYLRDIGETTRWDSMILPGMKEGIVGAVLASQDEMIERTNSFELYGADFLLGADYTPILLEINMGPAMAPSTSITADLCKRGLEDIIKVVLDTRHNQSAETGMFELLYKQEMGPRHPHTGLDLVVTGSKLTNGRKVRRPN
ncbi:tubulin glycylase 3A-like isoform X1 [Macrosteles quadrilineatus]|uniref:tubulin glycylase 3A-like isoform X1 n=2 Tax=Macrosteles quadrilineatus TaxID=74068 RepID=UPI0023E29ED6|nr:tubulin glycylase 3A-like isoform X1 [Macrosteles quadrilineatus]